MVESVPGVWAHASVFSDAANIQTRSSQSCVTTLHSEVLEVN